MLRRCLLEERGRIWEGAFVRESMGWKSPIGVERQRHGRRSVGQVPQKLVIMCKLYYSDAIRKNAKQLVYVNLALQLAVSYSDGRRGEGSSDLNEPRGSKTELVVQENSR